MKLKNVNLLRTSCGYVPFVYSSDKKKIILMLTRQTVDIKNFDDTEITINNTTGIVEKNVFAVYFKYYRSQQFIHKIVDYDLYDLKNIFDDIEIDEQGLRRYIKIVNKNFLKEKRKAEGKKRAQEYEK